MTHIKGIFDGHFFTEIYFLLGINRCNILINQRILLDSFIKKFLLWVPYIWLCLSFKNKSIVSHQCLQHSHSKIKNGAFSILVCNTIEMSKKFSAV
uniref:Uncharacterized protein n=1 Tax=Picea sitchensis TaxID=3332 RepID=D5AAC2_PICSI|nr:unknown [Picea sitchensis]